MVHSADSMIYDEDQNLVANERGSELLERLTNIEHSLHSLQRSHHTYLDVRQRTLCTWVRDAYKKDQKKRKDEIRRQVNKNVVHAGDLRTDALLVIERFHPTSSERQLFANLYGLKAEAFEQLDEDKCPDSVRLLDTGTSLLLDWGLRELPEDKKKDRDAVVALLESRKYEEVEQLSGTIMWE